jgi:hypothetical protein
LHGESSEAVTPAVFEETMSTSKQQANRSIEVYGYLYLFNHHCQAARNLLKLLSQQSTIQKNEADYYRALLEEVCASASQSVTEHVNGREITRTAHAEQKRLKLESKFLDRLA